MQRSPVLASLIVGCAQFMHQFDGAVITTALPSMAASLHEDPVRLTDRFFLGEPQIRGFDIRGVGPRVVRYFVVETPGVELKKYVNRRVDLQGTVTTRRDVPQPLITVTAVEPAQ